MYEGEGRDALLERIKTLEAENTALRDMRDVVRGTIENLVKQSPIILMAAKSFGIDVEGLLGKLRIEINPEPVKEEPHG